MSIRVISGMGSNRNHVFYHQIVENRQACDDDLVHTLVIILHPILNP